MQLKRQPCVPEKLAANQRNTDIYHTLPWCRKSVLQRLHISKISSAPEITRTGFRNVLKCILIPIHCYLGINSGNHYTITLISSVFQVKF